MLEEKGVSRMERPPKTPESIIYGNRAAFFFFNPLNSLTIIALPTRVAGIHIDAIYLSTCKCTHMWKSGPGTAPSVLPWVPLIHPPTCQLVFLFLFFVFVLRQGLSLVCFLPNWLSWPGHWVLGLCHLRFPKYSSYKHGGTVPDFFFNSGFRACHGSFKQPSCLRSLITKQQYRRGR